jgi:hypothetical protein
MASLNASITSTGLISSGDASGNLDLQSNGTTGLSIQSGGKVVLANTALSTANAGTLEYDGKVPYFTPLGTQRGVIPGMQYYALNSTVVGSNATGNQSIFNVGVTLSSSTIYNFEIYFVLIKTAGSTSHFVNFGFGGTATNNWINYNLISSFQTGTFGTLNSYGLNSAYGGVVNNTTAMTPMTGSATSVSIILTPTVKGIISVNSGGTFIPQYSLSAAPGGAYTTQIGSYVLIYPIGASGSNTSIGTWA